MTEESEQDKELKDLDKSIKKLVTEVTVSVFKALMLLSVEGTKVVSIIFEKREDDKVDMQIRIGALEFTNALGEKLTIVDTSTIRSIEDHMRGDKKDVES